MPIQILGTEIDLLEKAPGITGVEKIPTGGRGLYHVTPEQLKNYVLTYFTKEGINLGNVDNTSDVNKPISKQQQSALDKKLDKDGLYARSVNGYSGDVVLSAKDLKLGNVDNTSDLNKPISNLTKAALDLKADKSEVKTLKGLYDSFESTTRKALETLNIDIAELKRYVDTSSDEQDKALEDALDKLKDDLSYQINEAQGSLSKEQLLLLDEYLKPYVVDKQIITERLDSIKKGIDTDLNLLKDQLSLVTEDKKQIEVLIQSVKDEALSAVEDVNQFIQSNVASRLEEYDVVITSQLNNIRQITDQNLAYVKQELIIAKESYIPALEQLRDTVSNADVILSDNIRNLENNITGLDVKVDSINKTVTDRIANLLTVIDNNQYTTAQSIEIFEKVTKENLEDLKRNLLNTEELFQREVDFLNGAVESQIEYTKTLIKDQIETIILESDKDLELTMKDLSDLRQESQQNFQNVFNQIYDLTTNTSGALEELQSNLDIAKADITILDTSLKGKADSSAVAALSSQLVEVNNELTSVNNDITALRTSLDNINDSIVSSEAYAGLQNRVKANEEGIEVVNQDLVKLSTDLTSTKNLVDTKASTEALNSLTNRVVSTEDSLDVLNNDLVSLSTEVDKVAEDVATKASSSSVASLTNRVTTTEDSISTLNQDVVSLQTNIDKTNSEVSKKVDTTAFNNLSNIVQENKEGLRVANSEISALNTNLDLTNKEVATKASSEAVNSLANTVTTQGNDISTLNTATTQLKTDLATTKTDLTKSINTKANTSTVTALTNRVTTAENTIKVHNSDITELKADVELVTTELDTKASVLAVNNLTSKVEATEQGISTLNSDVSGLKSDITLTNAEVAKKASTEALNSLTNTVNAQGNTLSIANQDITQLKSDVDSVTKDVATKASSSSVAALTNTVEQQGNTLTLTNKDVTQLKTDLLSTNAEVAKKATTESVSSLRNTVEQQGKDLLVTNADIVNLSSSLNSMVIGGGNLLKGTQKDGFSSFGSGTLVQNTVKGLLTTSYTLTKTSATNSAGIYSKVGNRSVVLRAGIDYVVSFLCRGNLPPNYMAVAGGAASGDLLTNSYTAESTFNDTTFVRLVVRFKAPVDKEGVHFIIGMGSGRAVGTWLEVAEVMFQEGTKPTRWAKSYLDELDLTPYATVDALASLTTQVKDVDDKVTINAADIVKLDTSLTKTINDVATKASTQALNSLTSDVQELDKGLSTAQSNIAALRTDVTTAQNDIKTKASTSSVTGLTNRVTTAEGSIKTINTNLTALGTTLETTKDDLLAEINTKASSTAVAGLTNQVEQNSDSITSINEDLVKLNTDISNVNAEVQTKASSSALASLTNEVQETKAGISSLNEDVVSLNTDISNVRTDLAATNKTVATKANTSAVTALTNRVTTTETGITTLNQNVTKLGTDLTKVSNDVATKASSEAVATLTNRVTETEKDITSLNEDIVALDNTVDRVIEDVATKASSSALAALTNRVTTTETGIDTINQDLIDLSTDIDNVSKDVATKASTSALNAVTNRVTTAEGNIQTQNADITTLKSDVSTVKAGLDTKATTTAVNNLTNRVTTAEGTIKTQNADITTLKSDIVAINKDVATKASTSAVSSLEDRVEVTEGSIKTITSDITELSNQIDVNTQEISTKASSDALAGLTATVSEQGGRIAAQSTDISSLYSSISSVTVGTSNLLRGTAGEGFQRYNTAGTVTFTANVAGIKTYVYKIVKTSTGGNGIQTKTSLISTSIKKGFKYRLSFLARGTVLPNYVYLMRGATATSNRVMTAVIQPAVSSTDFQLYVFEVIAQVSLDNAYVMFGNTGGAVGSWLEFAEVMLYEGNAINTWSDSYQDLVDLTPYATVQAVSQLTTNVEQIDGRVTTNAADITLLKSNVATVEGTLATKVDTEAYNGLVQDVSVIEGNVTASQEDITRLQTGLASTNTEVAKKANTTALNSLTTEVNNVKGQVNTNVTNITKLGSDLETLSKNVDTKASNTAVSQLQTDMQEAEDRIDANTANITKLNTDLATTNANVATKASTSAVNSLTTRVTTAENTLKTHTADITKLTNDLAVTDGEMAKKASADSVTSLSNTVTNIGKETTTNSANITKLTNDLTATNNAVATKASTEALNNLSSTVTELDGTIKANVSDLTNLKASLDKEVVGGTNLLKGTRTDLFLASTGTTLTTSQDLNYLTSLYKASQVGSATTFGLDSNVSKNYVAKLKKGVEYTLSFSVRGVTPKLELSFIDTVTSTIKELVKTLVVNSTSNFTKEVITFTVTKDFSLVFLDLLGTVSGSGYWFEITEILLQEGNKPTSWIDSTQDLATADALSGLTTTVSELDGIVKLNTSDITNLNTNLSRVVGSNLVPNSSFEEVLAAQWFSWGSWTRTKNGRNSTYCLQATTNTTAIIFGNKGLVSGRSYKISLYYKKNSSLNTGATVQIIIRAGTTALATFTIANSLFTTSFKQYVASWIVPNSDVSNISFELVLAGRTAGTAYVDDLIIEDITELNAVAATKADATAVQALTTTVSELGNGLTSASNSITELTNNLAETNNAVATKASSEALNNLSSTVTSIDGVVKSNAQNITNLQNDLATTNANVATKASTSALNSLTTRVTSAEGTIKTQTSSLTNLSSSLENLTNQVATKADSSVLVDYYTKNAADSAIAGKLEEFSTNLLSTGNNLLFDTDKEDSWAVHLRAKTTMVTYPVEAAENIVGSITPLVKVTWIEANANSGASLSNANSTLTLYSGKKYTITWKAVTTGTLKFDNIQIVSAEGNLVLTGTPVLTADLNMYSLTFTLTATRTKCSVMIGSKSVTAKSTFLLYEVTLTEGSNKSNWSPNALQVSRSIVSNTTAISGITTSINNINNSIDQQATALTNLTTTLATSGNNYIQDNSFKQLWESSKESTQTGLNRVVDGWLELKKDAVAGYTRWSLTTLLGAVKLKELRGGIHTISFDAYLVSGTDVPIEVSVRAPNTPITATTVISKTDIQRYSVTLNLTHNYKTASSVSIAFSIPTSTLPGTVRLKNIQLEMGSIPTAYNPAAEDSLEVSDYYFKLKRNSTTSDMGLYLNKVGQIETFARGLNIVGYNISLKSGTELLYYKNAVLLGVYDTYGNTTTNPVFTNFLQFLQNLEVGTYISIVGMNNVGTDAVWNTAEGQALSNYLIANFGITQEFLSKWRGNFLPIVTTYKGIAPNAAIEHYFSSETTGDIATYNFRTINNIPEDLFKTPFVDLSPYAKSTAIESLSSRITQTENDITATGLKITNIENEIDLKSMSARMGYDSYQYLSGTTGQLSINIEEGRSLLYIGNNFRAGTPSRIRPLNNTLYRLRIRFKQLVTSAIRFGIAAFAQDGVSYLTTSGTETKDVRESLTIWHTSYPLNQWTELEVYFKGLGTYGGDGSLENPYVLPKETKYVSMFVSTGSSTLLLDYFVFESADGTDGLNLLGKAVQTLDNTVKTVDGKVENNSQAITNLNAALATTNTEVAKKANTTALNSLNSTVTSIDGRVSTNTSNITKLTTDLATTNSNVSKKADTTALTAVTGRVTETEKGIATNTNAITQLTNNLATTNAEVDKKANTTTVNSLDATVKEQGNQITATNTSLTNLSASLERIPKTSNLVPNGSAEEPLSSQWVTWGKWERVQEGRVTGTWCFKASATTNASITELGTFLKGRVYRLSLWAKRTSNLASDTSNTKLAIRSSTALLKDIQISANKTTVDWKYFEVIWEVADTVNAYLDLRVQSLTAGSLYVDDIVFEDITEVAKKADTTALNTLTARVEEVDGGVKINTADITQLKANLDVVEGDLSTKASNSAVNTLTTDLSKLNTTVTNQAKSITDLNASLATTNSNVSKKADTTALNTLSTRVTEVDGKVSTNSSSILNLTNSLDETNKEVAKKANATVLSGYYTKTETDTAIAGKTSELSASLLSTIDDNQLKAGSDNLWVYKDSIFVTSTGESGTKVSPYAYKVLKKSNYSGPRYSIPNTVESSVGSYLVFSFKLKRLNGTLTNIGGHCEGLYPEKVLVNNVNVTKSSTLYNGSFSIPTASLIGDVFDVSVLLRVTNTLGTLAPQPNRALTTLVECLISEVQLEYGSIRSAWKVSAKDIDSGFSDASSNLETTRVGLANSIDTVSNKVTNIEKGVESNSQAITSLNNSLSSTNKEVAKKADSTALTALDSVVKEQGNLITAQGTSLDSVSAKLNNQSIGGKNLLDYTSNYGTGIWDNTAQDKTTAKATVIEGNIVEFYSTKDGWNQFQTDGRKMPVLEKLELGKVYTLSAEFMAMDEESAANCIGWLSIRENPNGTSRDPILSRATGIPPFTLTANKWVKVYATAELTKSNGGDHNYWRVITGVSEAGTVRMRNIQLEEGNVLTAWHPSSYELQRQVEGNASATSLLEAKVTQQGNILTSQGTSVTALESSLANMAIGGTNLMPGTESGGYVSYGSAKVALRESPLKTVVYRFTKVSSVGQGMITDVSNRRLTIKLDKTYVLSVKMRGGGSLNYSYIMGAGFNGGGNAPLGTPTYVEPFNATTFVTAYWVFKGLVDTDTAYILFGNNTSPLDTWIEVGEVMIQEGNTPTAWSPSYLDKIDLDPYATTGALQELSTKVTSVEGNVAANSKSITDLNANLATTNSNVSKKADTTALNTLSTTVTNINNTVATQTQNITKLTNDLATANTNINTKASTTALNNLSSTVTEVDGRVKANTSSITSLGNRVTSTENGLATKAETSALNSYYTKTEADTLVTGRITEFNTSLKLAGDNLLVGTATPFTTNVSTGSNALAYPTYKLNGTINDVYKNPQGHTKVTLSYKWSVTGTNPTGKFRIQINGSPSTVLSTQITVSSTNMSGYDSFTVTMPSTWADKTITTLAIRRDALTVAVTISDVKLEFGEKATDWCLNSLEVANTFSANGTAIANLNTETKRVSDALVVTGQDIVKLNTDLGGKASTEALNEVRTFATNNQGNIVLLNQDFTSLKAALPTEEGNLNQAKLWAYNGNMGYFNDDGLTITTSTYQAYSGFIPCSSRDLYHETKTLGSNSSARLRILTYDENYNFLKRVVFVSAISSGTVILDTNVKYIRISCAADRDIVVNFVNASASVVNDLSTTLTNVNGQVVNQSQSLTELKNTLSRLPKQGNLIPNGNFEDPLEKQWESWGNWQRVQEGRTSTGWALKTKIATTNTAIITPRLKYPALTVFKFSLWAKCTSDFVGDNGNTKLSIRDDAGSQLGNVDFRKSKITTDWTYVELIWTVPETEPLFYFDLRATSVTAGSLWVTDIRCEEYTVNERLRLGLDTKADSTAVNNLTSTVTEIGTKVETNTKAITSLNSSVNTISDTIKTKADVTATNELKTQIVDINGKVTTNTSSITSLGGRLTTAEGNISKKADSSILVNYATITEATNLATSKVEEYKNVLTPTIDSLINSKSNENLWNYFSTTGQITLVPPFKIQVDSKASSDGAVNTLTNKNLLLNDLLVLSFNIRVSSGTLENIGWSHSGLTTTKVAINQIDVTSKSSRGASASSINISSITSAVDYDVTIWFKVNAVASLNSFIIQPNRSSTTVVSTLLSYVQLERGENKTPWSPSPTDVSSINTKLESLSATTATSINNINTSINTINGTLTSQATSISGLNTEIAKKANASQLADYATTVNMNSAITNAVNTYAASLVVTGANLLYGTEHYENFKLEGDGVLAVNRKEASTNTFSYKTDWVRVNPKTANQGRLILLFNDPTRSVNLQSRRTYTLSWRGQGSVSTLDLVALRHSGGTLSLPTVTMASTGGQTLHSVTFTLTSSLSNVSVQIGSTKYVTTSQWFTVADLSITEGSTVSDWSPNNDEIDTRIAGNTSAIQTINTSVQNIEGTLTNQAKAVTDLSTAVYEAGYNYIQDNSFITTWRLVVPATNTLPQPNTDKELTFSLDSTGGEIYWNCYTKHGATDLHRITKGLHVISFEAKVSQGTSPLTLGIYIRNDTDSTALTGVRSISIPVTDNYVRYSGTLNINADFDKTKDYRITFRVMDAVTEVSTLKVRKIQLEPGGIVTSFKLSPLDLQSRAKTYTMKMKRNAISDSDNIGLYSDSGQYLYRLKRVLSIFAHNYTDPVTGAFYELHLIGTYDTYNTATAATVYTQVLDVLKALPKGLGLTLVGVDHMGAASTVALPEAVAFRDYLNTSCGVSKDYLDQWTRGLAFLPLLNFVIGGSPGSADEGYFESTISGDSTTLTFSVVNGLPMNLYKNPYMPPSLYAKSAALEALTSEVTKNRNEISAEAKKLVDLGNQVSLNRESVSLDGYSSGYTTTGNNPSLTVTSSTEGYNGKVLVAGKNTVDGRDDTWTHSNDFIKVNPNTLYKITVRFRRLSGTGGFYAGVVCRNESNTLYVSSSASTSTTMNASPYIISNNKPSTTNWVTGTYYFKGVSSGSSAGSGASANQAKTFPRGTKYISPMFICNYNGYGTTEVDYVSLEPANGFEEIEATSSAISTLQSDILSTQDRLYVTNADVTQLTGQLTGLTYGNDNLVLGSETSTTSSSTSASNVTTKIKDLISPISAIYQNPQHTYVTISFDWESNATSGTWRLQLNANSYTTLHSNVTISSTNKSGSIVNTMVMPVSWNTSTSNAIEIRRDNVNGWVKISNLQLEYGKFATAWKPNGSELREKITANTSAISTLRADLTQEGNRITSASNATTALSNRIDTLNIGGSNLLKNTNWQVEKDFTQYGGQVWNSALYSGRQIFSLEGLQTLGVRYNAKAGTGALGYCSPAVPAGYVSLVAGRTYTISFVGQGTFNSLNYCYILNPSETSNQVLPSIPFGSGSFNRRKVTFVASNTTNQARVLIGANRTWTTSDWFSIAELKIEEGEYATNWSSNSAFENTVLSNAITALTSTVEQDGKNITSISSNLVALENTLPYKADTNNLVVNSSFVLNGPLAFRNSSLEPYVEGTETYNVSSFNIAASTNVYAQPFYDSARTGTQPFHLAVQPGDEYIFEAEALTTISRNVRLTCDYRTATGTTITTPTLSPYLGGTVTKTFAADTWETLLGIIKIPADSSIASVSFNLRFASSSTGASTGYCRYVRITKVSHSERASSSAISLLESNVSNINGNVNAITSDILNFKGEVGAFKTEVQNTYISKVDSNNAITQASTELVAQMKEVEGVGPNNYLINPNNNPKGSAPSTTGTVVDLISKDLGRGFGVEVPIRVSTNVFLFFNVGESYRAPAGKEHAQVNLGDTYWFEAEVLSTIARNVRVSYDTHRVDGTRISQSLSLPAPYGCQSTALVQPNTWVKLIGIYTPALGSEIFSITPKIRFETSAEGASTGYVKNQRFTKMDSYDDYLKGLLKTINRGGSNVVQRKQVISGYFHSTTFEVVPATRDVYDPNYYPIKPGDMLSCTKIEKGLPSGSAARLVYYDSNKVAFSTATIFQSSSAVNTTLRVTAPENAAYFRYGLLNSTERYKIEFGSAFSGWTDQDEISWNLGYSASEEAQATAISDLTATVTRNGSDIVATSKKVDDLSTSLTGPTGTVTALANANRTLTAQVQTLDGRVTSTVEDTNRLISSVDGKIASAITSSEVINGIKASYTIKLNTNNHVSGIGLYSEKGTSVITFDASSIRFANGSDVINPLVVAATAQTINGVAYPKGVWINTATIADASITNAKIGTLDAGKITTGTLAAGRIAAKSISADKLNVASISAVSSNFGKITTLKSSAKPNGARMVMEGSLITVYDDNNVVRVRLGLW